MYIYIYIGPYLAQPGGRVADVDCRAQVGGRELVKLGPALRDVGAPLLQHGDVPRLKTCVYACTCACVPSVCLPACVCVCVRVCVRL